MKVTRQQVAENRQRILASASQLFRSKGIDAVSVAEVMQCAGLTHGGFYRHFESKADLLAQALAQSQPPDIEGPDGFLCYMEQYLTAEHRDNPGQGCPFAALASGMRHQSPQARALMTAGARELISRMTSGLPASAGTAQGQTAIGGWAAMVGAMILARAVDDAELSGRILEETRRFIASSIANTGSSQPARLLPANPHLPD